MDIDVMRKTERYNAFNPRERESRCICDIRSEYTVQCMHHRMTFVFLRSLCIERVLDSVAPRFEKATVAHCELLDYLFD